MSSLYTVGTVFTPSVEVIGHIEAFPTASAMKQEVMFYQSTPEFVYEHGGPIAREFIEKQPLTGNVIVDVRVHRLAAGNYPAIPGYHLDWIPRKNAGREPDMSAQWVVDYEHVVMVIGETSLTEFVTEPIALTFPNDTNAFEHANDFIKREGIATWHVSNGLMVKFDSNTWHRPQPSENGEWRFLIRASRVAHARPVNEIRTQAQVYIPFKEAGW